MPDPAAPKWIVEPLASTHVREAFSCGHVSLDDYIRKFAGQNERSGVSRTYIALRPGEMLVRGYYSISAASVQINDFPDELRKRLPRYPMPVAHLGRLAVDATTRGQRLGEHLLLDAIARISQIAKSIAIHGVEVVAIDEAAHGFYLKYGFTPMPGDRHHLYLPLSKIKPLGLS